VDVKPKPDAAFDVSYVVTCSGLRADVTNQSSDADSYLWNFSDGFSSSETNVSHILAINSIPSVSLIAISDNSCRDTLEQTSNINDLLGNLSIQVPNVFTPNNDGTNDVFGLEFKNELSDCFSMKIFDRWGLLVHDSKDGGMKWDGRTNAGSKASPGTYFYILKIDFMEFKGHFTLLE
jgi:gliding motility-associated-like protein